MSRIKLMIVDDSLLIRKKIERAHCREQYEFVGHAIDGREAVDLFQQTKPELVTMDLTMPNMDGIECIKNLVNLDPDVKILVVSALSDEATGIRALEYGATGFLMKPFTEDEISEALEIASEELVC